MPLKIILRITINENTEGERIECVESIRKPKDEVNYVFSAGISIKKLSS